MNISVVQISIVLLVIGTILLAVIKRVKKVVKANGKKGLFYLLITILLFAVTGIFSMESLFSGNLMANFITIQLVFFFLGILHLLAMEAFLSWEEENKKSSQLIFSIIAAIIGSIGFINAAAYFGVPGFHVYFLSGLTAFFLPLIFRYLWFSIADFPVPVYQRWYYPVVKHVSPPDPDELRNLRIVALEFSKSPNAPKTIFTAKAPINMNFGKFFYHFINDYNQRTPEAPIYFKDEINQPYGWQFYVKPNLLGITRNINPELTISSNGLREHKTIVCQRIL